MLGDGALGFREFAVRERVPLAAIHDAVLEFLRDRDDAVLYGAQAVNAYVDAPRMTQDVDLMSTRAAELAEEIRALLATRFSIAARVRSTREGLGHRVYQLQKPRNRHLVDVRRVSTLPESRTVEGVRVVAPPDLVAAKLASMLARPKTPKGATDLADLRRLLLAFPELKRPDGPVAERLRASGAGDAIFSAWRALAAEEIVASDEDDT